MTTATAELATPERVSDLLDEIEQALAEIRQLADRMKEQATDE